jgi:acyl-coenzyme A thioesterase PaaI-like protein
MHTNEFWNNRGAGKLPGHMGMVVTHTGRGELQACLPVAEHLMAPNGYLHAGSLVTLGLGCRRHAP